MSEPQTQQTNPIVIQPHAGGFSYFRELFRFRELCYFFAWRDIKVRYKQAFFGLAWALIRPILTMVFFTLLFNRVAGLSVDPVNYGVFILLGMMMWQLVSTIANDSSLSLIYNLSIVTKTYFPRMAILIGTIAVNLFDFVICYILFFGAIWYTSTPLSWMILFSPLFILQTILLSAALSFWCSALTVRFRDFRFVVALGVQYSLFLSPVGYASSVIPGKWSWLYPLNPLVGIIDGLRWTTFGIETPSLAYSESLSLGVTALLLATGYVYFRKIERVMADII